MGELAAAERLLLSRGAAKGCKAVALTHKILSAQLETGSQVHQLLRPTSSRAQHLLAHQHETNAAISIQVDSEVGCWSYICLITLSHVESETDTIITSKEAHFLLNRHF